VYSQISITPSQWLISISSNACARIISPDNRTPVSVSQFQVCNGAVIFFPALTIMIGVEKNYRLFWTVSAFSIYGSLRKRVAHFRNFGQSGVFLKRVIRHIYCFFFSSKYTLHCLACLVSAYLIADGFGTASRGSENVCPCHAVKWNHKFFTGIISLR
jgi:hypothetical protein